MSSRQSRLPTATLFGKSFDRRWLTLSVTTVGTFMSILDTTIVNVALPSILRDFDAELGQGQMVITIYMLSLALLIPLSGYCADRFGMKRTYMVSLAAFTMGSVLCGLAWNIESLIAFRCLQGIGGGMMQPLSMAIVFSTVTPLERGRFMALTALPMMLAPMLGPTVGGMLADYVHWRAIFFVSVPIGIFNLVWAQRLLPTLPVKGRVKLDVPGFVLGLVAFPTLILGFSFGHTHGWLSPLVVTLLLAGLSTLTALVIVELRAADPLLRVRLLQIPSFARGMVLQFIQQFSLFGLQFLIPLWLQFAHGYSAARTGLLLLPSGIITFLSMNFGGRMYNRVGPRRLVFAGIAVLLTITAILSRSTAATSIALVTVLVTCRGIGMGLANASVMTSMMNAVPQQDIGRGAALANMGFRLYGALTAALLTTVLGVSLSVRGAPEGSSIVAGTAPPQLMFKAFDDAFLVMTLVAAVGLVVALFVNDRILEQAKRGGAPVAAVPTD